MNSVSNTKRLDIVSTAGLDWLPQLLSLTSFVYQCLCFEDRQCSLVTRALDTILEILDNRVRVRAVKTNDVCSRVSCLMFDGDLLSLWARQCSHPVRGVYEDMQLNGLQNGD